MATRSILSAGSHTLRPRLWRERLRSMRPQPPRTSAYERMLGVNRADYHKMPYIGQTNQLMERIPHPSVFVYEGQAGRCFASTRTEYLHTQLKSAWAALSTVEADAENRLIVSPGSLRQASRDLNTYFDTFLKGLLRKLWYRPVPDIIVQPKTTAEARAVFQVARETGTEVTIRGSGSTALGGSVPNNHGILLDTTQLREMALEEANDTLTVGSGVQFQEAEKLLAAHGKTFRVRTTNRGAHIVGWFASGNLGLGTHKYGPFYKNILSAEIVFFDGTTARLHSDEEDKVEVLTDRGDWESSSISQAEGKYGNKGWRLRDHAGKEGQFGLITQVTLRVKPLSPVRPLVFSFADDATAFQFASQVHEAGLTPTTVKIFNAHKAAMIGRLTETEVERKPMVYLDFDTEAERTAFLTHARKNSEAFSLATTVLTDEALRAQSRLTSIVQREELFPMRARKLGPSLLATELVMPISQAANYLHDLHHLARSFGVELEAEAYLAEGEYAGFDEPCVLIAPAFLCDERKISFLADMGLVPLLTELGVANHQGKPYLLQRFNAPYFSRRFSEDEAQKLMAQKRTVDPAGLLHPGRFFSAKTIYHNLIGNLFLRPTRYEKSLQALARRTQEATLLTRAIQLFRFYFENPSHHEEKISVLRHALEYRRLSAEEKARETLYEYLKRQVESRTDGVSEPGEALEQQSYSCTNCATCAPQCPTYALWPHEAESPEARTDYAEKIFHFEEDHRTALSLYDKLVALIRTAPPGFKHYALEIGLHFTKAWLALYKPLSQEELWHLELCIECGRCDTQCQTDIDHHAVFRTAKQHYYSVFPEDFDPEKMGIMIDWLYANPSYRRYFGLSNLPINLTPKIETKVLQYRTDRDHSECYACGICVDACPYGVHTNLARLLSPQSLQAYEPHHSTSRLGSMVDTLFPTLLPATTSDFLNMRLVITPDATAGQCVGCGACFEACPSNHADPKHRTLTVFPTPNDFAIPVLTAFLPMQPRG